MKFAVELCVATIALLHHVYAAPDPELVKRYNAEKVPELTKRLAGINITYKLINKGNDIVVGSNKQKADSAAVLAGWIKNPILSEGSTLFPKKSNIQNHLVRLDFQGGYGKSDGRYGNFQIQINGVTGKKSSIGSLQMATALAGKQPTILTELMNESVTKTLAIFVNPSSGL